MPFAGPSTGLVLHRTTYSLACRVSCALLWWWLCVYGHTHVGRKQRTLNCILLPCVDAYCWWWLRCVDPLLVVVVVDAKAAKPSDEKSNSVSACPMCPGIGLRCSVPHYMAVLCVCSMQTGPVTLSTRCVYVCNAGHGQDAGEADCHGNSGRWRGSGNRGWCSQHSVSLGSA